MYDEMYVLYLFGFSKINVAIFITIFDGIVHFVFTVRSRGCAQNCPYLNKNGIRTHKVDRIEPDLTKNKISVKFCDNGFYYFLVSSIPAPTKTESPWITEVGRWVSPFLAFIDSAGGIHHLESDLWCDGIHRKQ